MPVAPLSEQVSPRSINYIEYREIVKYCRFEVPLLQQSNPTVTTNLTTDFTTKTTPDNKSIVFDFELFLPESGPNVGASLKKAARLDELFIQFG